VLEKRIAKAPETEPMSSPQKQIEIGPVDMVSLVREPFLVGWSVARATSGATRAVGDFNGFS
jgi:hypothetical protein